MTDNVYGVSFEGDDNILKLGDDNGYTTLNRLKTNVQFSTL